MTTAEGAEEAFTRLVVEHQTPLFALARRLVPTRDDAEDLTAETFLRAWRAMADGHDPGHQPRAWLATIMLNERRNRARTASRRVGEVLVGEAAPHQAVEDVHRGPAAVAEQSAERRRLAAALDELPERQRVAVVLRHVLDLPTAGVAQALGCNEATARSHCRRGLLALRTIVGGEG